MNRTLLLNGAPLALLLVGCLSTSERGANWQQEVALATSAKLGGCAIGDLDPTRAGNELAVVSSTGEVFCIARTETGWQHEVVATLPGEMIQCAVGDLDPRHPGDELVAVGKREGGEDDPGAGVAWYFYKSADGWHSEELFVDTALLHAVCIGDIDPDRIGNEVLVAGYSRQVHVFAKDGERWHAQRAGELAGDAKGAAVARGGAAVACADGSVMLVRKGGDSFSTGLIKRFGHPQARIAGRGGLIAVCDNGGDMRLLDRDDSNVVHGSDERLRGAVIMASGDFGARIATAGYDGEIKLLDWNANDRNWTKTAIATDSDKFHHLTSGELPELGRVLVGVGYSGNVVVVSESR